MVRVFRETSTEHKTSKASANDDKIIRVGDFFDNVSRPQQMRFGGVVRWSSKRQAGADDQSRKDVAAHAVCS